jgi:hypothetical protein
MAAEIMRTLGSASERLNDPILVARLDVEVVGLKPTAF